MKRKAIRARAVELLDGISGFTIREFDGKNAADLEIPGIVVRWGEEELNEDMMAMYGAQIYDAMLLLDVTIKGDSSQDDIDDTIFNIRTLFRSDNTLDGNAVQNYPQSVSEPEATVEGTSVVLTFTVTIKVTYEE